MISICMIVKDEEKVLEACLQHLLPYGYEIVIADTGSKDNTKEIALKYTDKVFDYEWKQDFAAARNFVIDKTSNEFALIIDSDEMVTSLNKKELESLVISNPKAIGRLLRVNDYSRGEEHYRGQERVSRLFSKYEYEYHGMIHEQVVNKKGLNNLYYDIPVIIEHKGYDGDLDTRRRKTQRNITLLKEQLRLYGEDPYVFYQLAKSAYMQEDYQDACRWFEKALDFELDPELEYVQDLVESYGYSLINTERYGDAMLLLNVYDEFAVNADFIYLIGLIYMNNGRFEESIQEFLKATSIQEFKMEGVNSYRAYYNIGVIYECLGDNKQAKEYYEKCNQYQPAINRLSFIKNYETI